MKKTRSDQGRTDAQVKRNHEVLDLAMRVLGAVLYIVLCYQIADYMIKN